MKIEKVHEKLYNILVIFQLLVEFAMVQWMVVTEMRVVFVKKNKIGHTWICPF